MTTVTSNLPNSFLLNDIQKELNRKHKIIEGRILYIGLRTNQYRISEDKNEVSDYPVILQSINRR